MNTSIGSKFGRGFGAGVLLASLCVPFFVLEADAPALELDWSGQFRSEFHFLKNYTLDSSNAGGTLDPARANTGGYYIPGGGSNNATFETLFMRLRPKVIVNDNIYFKSELWLGNPVYGVFGDAYPYAPDQRNYYSSQSRGSLITAQRFWGEFLSDFGTIQVGRAPLDWGLGLFWNAGEGIFDRYESTGDTIRLISKFGPFTFSPSFIVYSTGNNFGGACTFNVATGTCLPTGGYGSVTDYSLILKYENLEEDFDGGVNFVRRIAAGQNDVNAGSVTYTFPGGAGGMAFNTWDLYARRKFGKFTLGAEAPITSGQVSGVNYSTFAIAGEASWKISDTWETGVKAGHAPGQPNGAATPDHFTEYYFNPNYHIANIMFNYQLANLAGYNTAVGIPPANGPYVNTLNNPNASQANLLSAWDNPVTNANYVSWSTALHTDKWTFDTGLTYAVAAQTAQAGQYFYNTWRHQFVPAADSQSSSLGVEWDLGTTFQWDEYFVFRWDLGLFFPGDFYKFSNVAGDPNATSTVFGTAFRVGVNF